LTIYKFFDNFIPREGVNKLLIFLFWITPILFILLLILFKINFKDNYLFWIFTLAYLFLFFIVPAIKYGANDFKSITFSPSTFGNIYSNNLIIKLYLYQLVFFNLFLIGYIITPFKIKKHTNNKLKFDNIIFVCNTLSIIGSVGCVYFSGVSISQLLGSARFEYWESRSTIPYLFSGYLQMLLTIPAYLIPYLKKNRFAKIYTLIAFLALFFTKMVLFGTRTPIIAVLTAFIIGMLNYYREHNIKLNKNRITIISLLCIHLAVVWQYIRYQKALYTNINDWISGLFNIKEAYTLSLNNGDLSYFFEASAATLYAIPRIHDYIYGDSYLRIFLFFIPSSLFPFKPEETQRVFASIINPHMYSIGATYPPSMIGDSYLNFGFFGVIIGLAIGILLKVWQNILNNPLSINKIAIGSAGITFLFLYMRGTFNGMYNLIFVWMFLIVFTTFFSKCKKHIKIVWSKA